MSDKIKTAKKDIEVVAERLASIKHPRAAELTRLAQMLGGYEMNYAPQTQDMVGGTGEGFHPGISSYVKKGPEEMVDDRRIHTCTVTFKAPPDVSEAEMMNYILGIGKELGVDVDSFKWAKSEAKQPKAV